MSLPLSINIDPGFIPYLSCGLVALFLWFSIERPKTADFPLLNKKREEFDVGGIDLVRKWLAKNGDQPVNVTADTGPFTILPTKYAKELPDKPELDFAALNYKVPCHLSLLLLNGTVTKCVSRNRGRNSMATYLVSTPFFKAPSQSVSRWSALT